MHECSGAVPEWEVLLLAMKSKTGTWCRTGATTLDAEVATSVRYFCTRLFVAPMYQPITQQQVGYHMSSFGAQPNLQCLLVPLVH